MIKSSDQSKKRTRRGRTRAGAADTRLRILEAALAALRENGYTATTARVIATHGGFPVGSIFYHFHTLDELLLAVLDHTSARRLPVWRESLAGVGDVTTLIGQMQQLYAQDVASAHALAVRELVANGDFSQRLAPELATRMQPWFDLAESVAGRVLAGSPLLEVLGPRELAVTAVALYLGLETVANLSGETTSAEKLFAAGVHFAPLLAGAGRGRAKTSAHPTRIEIE
jgi:AcrR family transcriptional regulator